MKLLTHNLLTCPKSGCANAAVNYPLAISIPEPSAVQKDEEAEFNADFVVRMLDRMEWDVLRQAGIQIGLPELPVSVPDNAATDTEFLKHVHSVLMGVHVVIGTLTCPNCKREYPISDGIPNMLLSEEEV